MKVLSGPTPFAPEPSGGPADAAALASAGGSRLAWATSAMVDAENPRGLWRVAERLGSIGDHVPLAERLVTSQRESLPSVSDEGRASIHDSSDDIVFSQPAKGLPFIKPLVVVKESERHVATLGAKDAGVEAQREHHGSDRDSHPDGVDSMRPVAVTSPRIARMKRPAPRMALLAGAAVAVVAVLAITGLVASMRPILPRASAAATAHEASAADAVLPPAASTVPARKHPPIATPPK